MGGVLGELVGNVMGANLNRPRLVVDNTTPRPFAPKPSPTNVRHLPGPAGGERPATRQEIADAMKKLRKQQGWDDAEHPNEGDE